MSRTILLDGPTLALVLCPRDGPRARRCGAWLRAALRRGERVAVPELAEYEVRRHLLRAGRPAALRRLDALVDALGRQPIGPGVLRLAAALWAGAEGAGDADCITAATARHASSPGAECVVAGA